MAVLSVDLAYHRWSDLGIVVLNRPDAPASAPNSFAVPAAEIECELIPCASLTTETGAPNLLEKVDPLDLANRLQAFCKRREIQIILLDGPQAWRSKTNGLEYSRVCERALNTAAKTGLPGEVRPRTYTKFAEFSIAVFNALTLLGWNRFSTNAQPGSGPDRVLIESYPHAAWKSLGLKPLPAKRRARLSHMVEAYNSLHGVYPFTVHHPNHDQIQAIVSGLPGLDLESGNLSGYRIVGRPPHREEGHWREGFIVLPLPPSRAPGIRWL